MLIRVNGEEYDVVAETTIEKLLQILNKKGTLVVSLNQTVCPKSQHPQTELKNGDTLDIISIIGGG